MTGRIIRFLGSLILLGGVLWWGATDVVWSRLRAADPGWVLVAILSLSLSTFSMARRWQITARALELELTFGAALKEYYLSLLANSVLPGGVVGDVSRAVRTRHHGDLKRAAHSVLAERLMGQAAMLLVLALGMTAAVILPGGVVWPSGTGWVLVLGLGLAGTVAAWSLRIRSTAEFTRFCLRLMIRPEVGAQAILATALLILGLYASARATGTILPLEACFTVLPLVLCAMLVPISVAGWGWREGAAAALFPLLGASSEAGIAMGICYGAVMLVAALPAIGFLFVPASHPVAAKSVENT